MSDRAPQHVVVSASWHELRTLALCAGVVAALDDRLGRTALAVLRSLDLQHPQLPSLAAAAERMATGTAAALVGDEVTP